MKGYYSKKQRTGSPPSMLFMSMNKDIFISNKIQLIQTELE